MAGRHRSGAPYEGTRIAKHSSGRSAPRARGDHQGKHRANPIVAFLRSFGKPTPEYTGRHQSRRVTNSVRGAS